jgi:hypothetical protein
MNRGEKLVVAGVVALPAISTVFWLGFLFWIPDPTDRFLPILFAVASAALAVALGLFTSGILFLKRKGS